MQDESIGCFCVSFTWLCFFSCMRFLNPWICATLFAAANVWLIYAAATELCVGFSHFLVIFKNFSISTFFRVLLCGKLD